MSEGFFSANIRNPLIIVRSRKPWKGQKWKKKLCLISSKCEMQDTRGNQIFGEIQVSVFNSTPVFSFSLSISRSIWLEGFFYPYLESPH